jgi:hypothetical protein
VWVQGGTGAMCCRCEQQAGDVLSGNVGKWTAGDAPTYSDMLRCAYSKSTTHSVLVDLISVSGMVLAAAARQ